MLVEEDTMPDVGKPGTRDPRTLPLAAPEAPQPDRAMLSVTSMDAVRGDDLGLVVPGAPLPDSGLMPKSGVAVDASSGGGGSMFAVDPACRVTEECLVRTCQGFWLKFLPGTDEGT